MNAGVFAHAAGHYQTIIPRITGSRSGQGVICDVRISYPDVWGRFVPGLSHIICRVTDKKNGSLRPVR